MRKKEKILIIKAGFSETLDGEDTSRKASLGDVLRTTPLLHVYKNEKVTWVTEESAFPLLRNNKYIERILPYDLTTVLQLESEEFDSVINLEKVPGICALADKIKAWKRFGFRFNTASGKAEAYDKSFEALAVSSDLKLKKENKKTAQQLLFEMVGMNWQGEKYILGYKPKTKREYDIGFNTRVGSKWPNKAWNLKNWDKLEYMLNNKGMSVTRQEKQDESILKNLDSYMDWVNSCDMIVSNDSLGVHVAIALEKKVLGLFGPTSEKEMEFYGLGKAIVAKPFRDCMPCFKGKCKYEKCCIDYITPERVYGEIVRINHTVAL